MAAATSLIIVPVILVQIAATHRVGVEPPVEAPVRGSFVGAVDRVGIPLGGPVAFLFRGDQLL